MYLRTAVHRRYFIMSRNSGRDENLGTRGAPTVSSCIEVSMRFSDRITVFLFFSSVGLPVCLSLFYYVPFCVWFCSSVCMCGRLIALVSVF